MSGEIRYILVDTQGSATDVYEFTDLSNIEEYILPCDSLAYYKLYEVKEIGLSRKLEFIKKEGK